MWQQEPASAGQPSRRYDALSFLPSWPWKKKSALAKLSYFIFRSLEALLAANQVLAFRWYGSSVNRPGTFCLPSCL
jgi:hypothetical protein